MIKYKEYATENDTKVDISKLQSDRLPWPVYSQAHGALVIPCHDIVVKYDDGALLVKRKVDPVKDVLWPVGGRIYRGMKTEQSLRRKVREETNLELRNIEFLGVGRTYFQTAPVGHGKGTDTLNLMYFGEGIGELKLDNTSEQPTIVSRAKYTKRFSRKLHPYVRDFMDLVFHTKRV